MLTCGVPTMLVTGELELADMHVANAALAAHMPHAEARLVPGVGHGWVGANPDLYAHMVDAWMNGRELPDELRPEPSARPQSSAVRRIAAAAV
jgi:hypothetical protein